MQSNLMGCTSMHRPDRWNLNENERAHTAQQPCQDESKIYSLPMLRIAEINWLGRKTTRHNSLKS